MCECVSGWLRSSRPMRAPPLRNQPTTRESVNRQKHSTQVTRSQPATLTVRPKRNPEPGTRNPEPGTATLNPDTTGKATPSTWPEDAAETRLITQPQPKITQTQPLKSLNYNRQNHSTTTKITQPQVTQPQQSRLD